MATEPVGQFGTGVATGCGALPPETIEQEIQRKGLTAPRVTPADIEDNIASEHYFTAAQGVMGAEEMKVNPDYKQVIPGALELLTICVLVLKNGFTVTGESACASPANFNAELVRKIARANAVTKIWPLMGYALRERLREAGDRAVIGDNGRELYALRDER